MPGGGSGDTTSTSVQELSDEQKAILKGVTPILSWYGNKGVSGLRNSIYPNSTVAPINAREKQGMGMLQRQALGPLQQSADSALSGLNFLTSGRALDPNTNPALRGAIDASVRPLTENFGRVIMPEIRGDEILSGGYGSNRGDINTRLAGEDLSRQIGDTSSQIAFQGYNAGLDAQSRALAFAPSVMQGAQLPGLTVSGIGEKMRAGTQANIDSRVQQWYNKQFLPLTIAQQIAGTAFGYPGGSLSSTTPGAGGGGVSGALGGALGGAALGTSIMPGWGTGIGAVMGGLMGLF